MFITSPVTELPKMVTLKKMYSASSLCNIYCREQFYSYRFRLKEFVCACFFLKKKKKRKIKQNIWEKTAAYLGQL